MCLHKSIFKKWLATSFQQVTTIHSCRFAYCKSKFTVFFIIDSVDNTYKDEDKYYIFTIPTFSFQKNVPLLVGSIHELNKYGIVKYFSNFCNG